LFSEINTGYCTVSALSMFLEIIDFTLPPRLLWWLYYTLICYVVGGTHGRRIMKNTQYPKSSSPHPLSGKT